MQVLIVYATNSGSTQMVGELVAKVLTTKHHTVTTKQVREAGPDELGNYDLVIFGSPTWDYEGKEGQLHEDFPAFIEKFAGKTYPGKKFAVFGLGDKSYTIFCGSADQLEAFVAKLQGQLVVLPLKINGFYFDEDNNTKIVNDWAEKLATTIAS